MESVTIGSEQMSSLPKPVVGSYARRLQFELVKSVRCRDFEGIRRKDSNPSLLSKFPA